MPAKIAAFLIIVLGFTSSCSDPSQVGIELDPDNNQIGVFYHEIPLTASMVLLDSFNTTNANVMVVGGDNSPFFGSTESIGYSRMAINVNAAKPPLNAILDSAKFSLDVDNVFGDDLSIDKSISVHPLLEPIRDISYYNSDALPFEDTPIASGSFDFSERQDTLVFMPLDEALSVDFFNRLRINDPVFNNLFTFREFFKGIAIKGNPDENTSTSIGLGGGTSMLFYYHVDGDTVASTYTISTGQSRNFNGVVNDRSGTPTSIITESGVAYPIEGEVGSKANVGLLLKLDMTPFHTFLDTIQNITFNQVLMELGPVSPFAETNAPIRTMTMFLENGNNGILPQAPGELNYIEFFNQQGQPQPNQLTLTTESRLFSQFITTYTNQLYRQGRQRTDLLLYPNIPPVSSDDFKRSLREYRVDTDNIKLKIYYSRIR
ncbi:DUF4270 family protein [Pararhodonellum marinum]|uniref:DUF4270 family protein n=1 Tax=Pararhodonellum marinum TaxID=2755358 RepID=UPI0018909E80|nr:DUF4270 family protein [Pararhodonellum marinum]